MRCFWDERQRWHAPAAEFFNGKLHPAAEHAGRVDAILAAIGPTEAADDSGMDPLLLVHGNGYLDLLRDAHAEWIAAGREGEVFPYAFPLAGRRPLYLSRIDARLGQHSFDTSTPIGPGTWDACYWSAQTALGANRRVVQIGVPAEIIAPSVVPRRPGEGEGAALSAKHRLKCAEAALR